MKRAILSQRAMLLAAVPILCSSWGLAQNQPAAPSKIQLTVYQIKPDMVGEWEQFLKDESNPAATKAGISMRSHWQTAFGGATRFTRVQVLDKFAAMDEPNPLIKALGQEGYDQFMAKARKFLLAPQESWVLQLRSDMSFPADIGEQQRHLAVVNHIKVMPGRLPDFERIIKTDVVPALRKADVNGYQVYENLVGGDPNEFHTVTYYSRFADFDKDPPLIRGLGQDGYRRLMAKSVGIVRSMDREVIRYREDLSIRASQPRASK